MTDPSTDYDMEPDPYEAFADEIVSRPEYRDGLAWCVMNDGATFSGERLKGLVYNAQEAFNQSVESLLHDLPPGWRLAVGAMEGDVSSVSWPMLKLEPGIDPPLGRVWTVYSRPGPDIPGGVRNILAVYLPHIDSSNIPDDAKIMADLGADSLDATEIVMACEEEFDCFLGATAAAECKTVGELIRAVETACGMIRGV